MHLSLCVLVAWWFVCFSKEAMLWESCAEQFKQTFTESIKNNSKDKADKKAPQNFNIFLFPHI